MFLFLFWMIHSWGLGGCFCYKLSKIHIKTQPKRLCMHDVFHNLLYACWLEFYCELCWSCMANSDSFVCFVMKNFLLILNLYDNLMIIKREEHVFIQHIHLSCFAMVYIDLTLWWYEINCCRRNANTSKDYPRLFIIMHLFWLLFVEWLTRKFYIKDSWINNDRNRKVSFNAWCMCYRCVLK